MRQADSNRSLILWLCFIAFMVFCMVFIGGITRLTDSGLSMVDWRPIMGAIPPLTDEAWIEVFNQYRQFPEYKIINKGMSLSDFKVIFFWEYFHRLFGRLIGIAFIVPFIYFAFKNKLSKSFAKKVFIAFILGGLQGLMGWYMVKSGLVNKPDVSHLRLAAHLGLAFIIIGYIAWLILELIYPKRFYVKGGELKGLLFTFVILLSVQITYGAFVAGLDAGLTFNTFPKMGRHWLAPDAMFMAPVWLNFVENTAMVQFIHRILAWVLVILTVVFLLKRKNVSDFMLKKSILLMSIMVFIQFTLGVMTLVMYVPVSLASLHQVCACILFLLALRATFFACTREA